MTPPDSTQLWAQVAWLFILAIPISSISWTVTHEEIFREAREFCANRSKTCGRLFERKMFYIFTCEYCFSHYVTILFLVLTRYRLLLDDWRGYVISVFALTWMANVYMSLYGRLRVDITAERVAIASQEVELASKKNGDPVPEPAPGVLPAR